MAESPYWNDVLVSLRQIMRATDLQSKRMIKVCGLTTPQVMVLRAIKKLGDVTVKRVSREVSLSQATVTTILNRLEERQLIERVRSSSDKRIVNARLTVEGREVLSTTPPLLHEKFIERFESLEDWEENPAALSPSAHSQYDGCRKPGCGSCSGCCRDQPLGLGYLV